MSNIVSDGDACQSHARVGVVKWFDTQKGYGFIDGGGRDYFVHTNYIGAIENKTLKVGQKVKFMGKLGNRGWVAYDVNDKNKD